jgi:hypothetical protein
VIAMSGSEAVDGEQGQPATAHQEYHAAAETHDGYSTVKQGAVPLPGTPGFVNPSSYLRPHGNERPASSGKDLSTLVDKEQMEGLVSRLFPCVMDQ